ncbi:MAG: TRAP transporter small permease [Comamonadaceae bacterium]|nr:MAG: TRAP transporter small permease [Comamonadaceae bacterium]
MRKISLWIDVLAAMGMLALILLIVGQVIFRSVFSSSLAWSEEVGAYLMIWSGLLGSASHLQHDSFMSLSLVNTDRKRVFWVTTAIAASATIGFLLVMFYAGMTMVFGLKTNTLSPAARIPMAYIYAVFPLAAALIAFGYLKGLSRKLRGQAPQAGELPC